MRTIPNFENYAITEDGQVWSKPRVDSLGRKQGNRWLKPGKHLFGYPTVALCIDGIPKSIQVHRLVLDAFVGPCPEGMEACHNNGKPADNRLENLRWDYPINNTADKYKHQTILCGTKNPTHKLSEEEVKQIFLLASSGTVVQRRLAEQFNVSPQTITNIKTGKQWSSVTNA